MKGIKGNRDPARSNADLIRRDPYPSKSMTTVTSNGISSFGVLNEAEQQLLTSENEEKKIKKTTIKTNEKFLDKKRQERIDNLEERLEMLGKGRSGCLKFLKIFTIVVSVVSAVFTGGASLSALAISAAVRIASAAVMAIGAITTGLEQLKEAMGQKKIILNQAEGQNILAIIMETEKWIEDEKSQLKESQIREQESLEEYKHSLKDLEESFKSMIQI